MLLHNHALHTLFQESNKWLKTGCRKKLRTKQLSFVLPELCWRVKINISLSHLILKIWKQFKFTFWQAEGTFQQLLPSIQLYIYNMNLAAPYIRSNFICKSEFLNLEHYQGNYLNINFYMKSLWEQEINILNADFHIFK